MVTNYMLLNKSLLHLSPDMWNLSMGHFKIPALFKPNKLHFVSKFVKSE